MTEWWEQPYERGDAADLPGIPQALYPPDAEEHGQKPKFNAEEVLAYKRIVARLGRWTWDPDGWDEEYSNAFPMAPGRTSASPASPVSSARQTSTRPRAGSTRRRSTCSAR